MSDDAPIQLTEPPHGYATRLADPEMVQQALHKLPWGHNLVLLDKLPGPETGLSARTHPEAY